MADAEASFILNPFTWIIVELAVIILLLLVIIGIVLCT